MMNETAPTEGIELLTTQEVADLVKVYRKTVPNLVKQGQLPKPVISVGNVRRWRKSDIVRHLEARANMG